MLFVSHNMAAVKSLTTHGIVLDSGRLNFDGGTEGAVERYAQLASMRTSSVLAKSWGRGLHTAVRSACLLDESSRPATQYLSGSPLRLKVVFETDGARGLSLEVFLLDSSRCRIGLASTFQFQGQALPSIAGTYACTLNLEPLLLASGSYSLDVTTSVINAGWDHYVEMATQFDVAFSNPLGFAWDFRQAYGFGSLAMVGLKAVEFSASIGELSVESLSEQA